MPKYVFIYHGGKEPKTAEENAKVMGEWMKWFEKIGPAVVDSGAPISRTRTVSPKGVADGGTNPANGYSIVTAKSMAGAVKIAKGCPILKSGGRVEVGEAVDMQG
jgi:hypothetical protein